MRTLRTERAVGVTKKSKEQRGIARGEGQMAIDEKAMAKGESGKRGVLKELAVY